MTLTFRPLQRALASGLLLLEALGDDLVELAFPSAPFSISVLFSIHPMRERAPRRRTSLSAFSQAAFSLSNLASAALATAFAWARCWK